MTILALFKLLLAVALVAAVATVAEWEALHIGNRTAQRLTSGVVISTFVLLLLLVLMRPLG
jgi:hypothetical protein